MKVPKAKPTGDNTYSPYPLSPKAFQPPSLPKPQNPTTSSRQSQPPLPDIDTDLANSSSYKVARAISSCTRCRSRKQKCDGKLPACSACERAKVECIGFDAISKTNISRNYLHQLEQEVQSLRAQVTALTSADPIGHTKKGIAASASQAISSFRSEYPIDPSLTQDVTPIESPYLESPSLAGHLRRSSDFPFPSPVAESPRSPFNSSARSHFLGQGTGPHATSLTRMVHDAAHRTGHAANGVNSMNPPGSTASGSDRGSVHGGHESPMTGPDPVEQSSSDSMLSPHYVNMAKQPHSASSTYAHSVASSGKLKRKFAIPPLPPQQAVERLVAAYVDFVGVTGPIIHIPTLGRQLMKIREGVDVEEGDVFVVMMVLALSTMASSRFVDPPDELRACSESFHAEAMKHLDAVFEEQSYVGLQAILLLVWYSLLNPDKGSIWFLVGLATRTCVDLGYHNEHNIQIDQLDALELDMRRRLFWCTYKMDRLLSQSLGRPPSIPDGFINVPMPSALHDIDIHAHHYGSLSGEGCSYKAVFLYTIKLRQLQSEILFNTYAVHGSTGRIPSDEWFDDCYRRLEEWLQGAPEPRGTVSTEGYAISFHNSCLLLYRPSPGCTRPGRKALSIVLSSSKYIIQIYRRMQLNNRISWLWMTSHFSFMAGLSFLYAYFNLYNLEGGQDVPTIEDAMANIQSCLGVLDSLAPRVPSAAACHDTLRNLSQAIFKQLADLCPHPTSGSPSGGRLSLLRGAPISSSREDPLPNETFPAPLPAVALPYELSLLDNLFRNPMASHNKASDYTSNKRSGKHSRAQELGNAGGGGEGYSYSHSHSHSHAAPNGLPPRAFHTESNAHSYNGQTFAQPEPASMMMGTYGMAAQLAVPSSSAPSSMFPPPAPSAAHPSPGLTALANTAATIQAAAHIHGQGQNGDKDGELSLNSVGAEGEPGSFDIFSFLMDEDGGLGGGFSDVPADFSLWS